MFIVIVEVDEETGAETLRLFAGANVSAPKGKKVNEFETLSDVVEFAGGRKLSVGGVDIDSNPPASPAEKALTAILSSLEVSDNYPQRLKAVQQAFEELGKSATPSLIFDRALAILKGAKK